MDEDSLREGIRVGIAFLVVVGLIGFALYGLFVYVLPVIRGAMPHPTPPGEPDGAIHDLVSFFF